MFFKFEILLGLLISTSFSKPTDSLEKMRMTCRKMFEKRGIEIEQFALAAAHGSHSLYLEDLRHFFEDATSERNGIPILNFDFSDPEVIWPNSRLAGYDDDLISHGFKTMDFVFSHENPNFLIQKLTTVEKLGHSFHMQEMWMKAQKTYSGLKANPPSDVEDFCKCANDVEANGIIDELLMIAKTNKNFGNEIPIELLNQKEKDRLIDFDYGMNYDKVETKPKSFDYRMNYDKKNIDKKTNPKGFDYGMNYDKEIIDKKSDPKGFDYGMNYNKDNLQTVETKPKGFDYGMNYNKVEANPKGFDYGMNYDKENIDKKINPKGFDYRMNYDKEKIQNVENKPKSFDYGMNYDKVEANPKGFDYGMNYDKETIDKKTNPKGFDYGMNYNKDNLQMVETKPKGFDYGMNYDKNIVKTSVPRAFDYGMNYNSADDAISKSSNAGHTYGKWLPGTVSSSNEYLLMKEMLIRSSMSQSEIDMFSNYIYCKLNH